MIWKATVHGNGKVLYKDAEFETEVQAIAFGKRVCMEGLHIADSPRHVMYPAHKVDKVEIQEA